MTPKIDLVPLSALPRDLAAYAGRPVASYRALYGKALDGVIPAQQINRIWHWNRADLPAIAAALSIHAAAPGPQKRPRRLRTESLAA
jgi:hypothetical protein